MSSRYYVRCDYDLVVQKQNLQLLRSIDPDPFRDLLLSLASLPRSVLGYTDLCSRLVCSFKYPLMAALYTVRLFM